MDLLVQHFNEVRNSACRSDSHISVVVKVARM